MSETPENTHDGKVLRVAGDKLTTTCSKGNEHNYTMTKDAKVSCDGKTCKVADLATGTNVRVTTHKDDKTKAVSVESIKTATGAASKA